MFSVDQLQNYLFQLYIIERFERRMKQLLSFFFAFLLSDKLPTVWQIWEQDSLTEPGSDIITKILNIPLRMYLCSSHE